MLWYHLLHTSWQQPMRNSNQLREMHQRSTQRQEQNKQERKQTQYLTRFCLCLSDKGEREILLIQWSSTSFSRDTIHGSFTPLFIAKESQDFRKSQLDSTLFQKRSPNPIRRSRVACRSTGPVDRPFPSVDRSVDRRQQKVQVCQSVDWWVDRAGAVHIVHAGRPGGRPATILAAFWIAFSLLCTPTSVLFLPMS